VQHILVAREPGATSLGDYESLGSGVAYSRLGAFGFGRAAYTAPAPGMASSRSIYRTDSALPLYTGGSFDADLVAPPLNVLGQTVVLEADRVVATDGEDTWVIAERFQDFGDGSTEYFLVSFPPPDIDGVGRVAFQAHLKPIDPEAPDVPCNNKILLSGLTPPIELSEGGFVESEQCPFASAGTVGLHKGIAVNDAGSAAFDANLSTPSGPVIAIFVDRTVWWEARSPGFDGITGILSFALNDEGLLAYVLEGSAVPFGPGRILFTGRPPDHERVIGSGDALCGGTVSTLSFHRYGLNDAGELALLVQLTDFRRLLVRAEPTELADDRCILVPEADAWPAALAALAALSVRRRAAGSLTESRAAPGAVGPPGADI
jgi:hypothetical protein